ncbi:unnamed protein product, partial [Tetraodon nigroviridis]
MTSTARGFRINCVEEMANAAVASVGATKATRARPANARCLKRRVRPPTTLCVTAEASARAVAVSVMTDTSVHTARRVWDVPIPARPNSNCSDACGSVTKVDRFTGESKQCELKDSEGCWIKFSLEQIVGPDDYYARIQSERVCPEPLNTNAIIGGSIALVALIGILVLMVIKLLIWMNDRKEYKKFEKEQKKAKWNDDMALYQVLFLLLLMGQKGLCQAGGECKTVASSCSDCIRSGPDCVWCMQEAKNFTKPGEQETARCNTIKVLTERGCAPPKIIFPQNNITVLKKLPLSESFARQEPIQLSPQAIHLKVRPGSPTTFRVSYKRVQGYPVDLYYLMDLSNSMKDDLKNVKQLGNGLLTALKTITEHAQIGFGAFVDKTVLPFTNTNEKKLQTPCDDNDCQAAFGYRHVLSLTPSEEEFKKKVETQLISGNLDPPEGGLDAMMQAAVCGDTIGWRNSSTRLIVLATDAGFHMAGDGKLAGILEPNDQRCYMKDNLYYKSRVMDYPSVGQLAVELEKNNIQTIFAVTENVNNVYKQLSAMIPKSEVGVLSADSNNVVDLIKTAYSKLSSKVTLTHDRLPKDVQILYTPDCQAAGQPGPSEGVCDNVKEKQEIAFNVTVVANSCMKDQSFTVRVLGIKDTLTVTVSTNCECDCRDTQDSQQQACSGRGSLKCGVCSCNDGFIGQSCECSIGNKDEQTLRDSCRRDKGVECEGRGDCVCGRCHCHGSYHGDFCQCDDEHCERFQNKLCGGNGKCSCGQCRCNEGYEGSACQCKVSEEACQTPNNTVCYGRGKCTCSRCECNDGYQRPHCKTCL